MPSGSILIAEDNQELGEQLTHFFKEMGNTPTWVTNGQDLVDQFVKDTYDIILCDLKNAQNGWDGST